MKFMYITNDRKLAEMVDNSTIDYLFIDLEKNGKEERQKNMDTVKSDHSISDIHPIKSSLRSAEVLVRINPIFDGSEKEINQVIEAGADIIMLPYFKTADEVSMFLNIVNGRSKTMLLLETKEAIQEIDHILELRGIDSIHIGLNDLSLSLGKKFMFELLCDGTIEAIIDKIKVTGIPYGFGGVSALDTGVLTANLIIEMHKLLGSSQVILSRGFYNEIVKKYGVVGLNKGFYEEVKKLRNYYDKLKVREYSEALSEVMKSVERICHAK